MENSKKLNAFVKSLPIDSTEYFQILGESQTRTMRSGMVTLKSGDNVGEHTTNNYEEMLVILNGKGEVEINKNEKLDIEKGQIVYIPPNTVHN
ncbi:MAG: cupin domain-containing protein, partial [Ignavibacteriae bacterium]|nr:cupin domain-containing protein [Ignavibacteriota bacterium]